MKSVYLVAIGAMVCACSALGYAQKEICIGSIGGGDALTFNIQQPILKAIETEASSRGVKVTTRLLMNNNEKAAKSEMSALKCDYGLITDVSREWPQPKSSSGINAGGGGGGGKDEDTHPPSTSHFTYSLLDKDAKRLDRFKTQITMPQGAKAKDVDPDVKEMIQEVANWTLDTATTSGK